MAEIQGKVTEKGKRNVLSRVVYAKDDKEAIAGWKSDLNSILNVFNVCSTVFTWPSLIVPFQTELAMNTHVMVLDIHRNVVAGQEGASGQHHSVGASPSANGRMLTTP